MTVRNHLVLAAGLALAGTAAACSDSASPTGTGAGTPAVRIVNGFSSPVDVLIDGSVALSGVAPGSVATANTAAGQHSLQFRTTGGSSTTSSQSINAAAGALSTVAVVKNATSGDIATATLDDTGSVVPAGATKVRVIHMAANAGVLQVYRTQPDYQTPIDWQFPFTYQANPTSLSAPFYQSTVGSWEIRIWQTPADSSGWSSSNAVRVVLPMASGEKHTVIILDKPGGGVQVQVL